ncbi:MAG: hypothetical protein ABJA79_07475 [Parafilimonas sp.]
MRFKLISLFLLTAVIAISAKAQRIDYSAPDKDDVRSVNFEVIGKINVHYLVYKNVRTSYTVSVFDDAMKEIEKVQLDFLPDRIINSDIINYRDYFYFIYQYQKKNEVYCMAAKMDGDGKLTGEPKQLDTTLISFFASNKIYTVINSEDKQKIGVFKINTKDPENYQLSVSLFDADLNFLSKTFVSIPMQSRNSFLTEFELDNEGSLVFVKASGSSENNNISNLTLITKEPDANAVKEYNLNISNLYLDDIRVKVDNANKHYLVASFYSKQRRGNIDGLYCMLWDKSQAAEIKTNSLTFSDELRNNAKGEGSSKTAFNDFFLQNILMRKDGGFAIASESFYSSTRGIYNNRWDNTYNSPYWATSDYYLWTSPYAGYYYPWWRSGYSNTQTTRYFADNVVIMSFDSATQMQWANVIQKSQYDDNSDNFIGYGTYKTESQVNFLFNQLEKRNLLLTVQGVAADGQITRNPTLKNLDKGYVFMPRYARQVSSHEVIVPCQYRNYICFAKIIF